LGALTRWGDGPGGGRVCFARALSIGVGVRAPFISAGEIGKT
jgi:hypothetical protein